MTADEVIERHTKAVGGRAAIEAIQSIEFDLHITDPKFEVDGTYFAARPGKMRIDVKAGGEHVFTEAFDGQKGWEGKGTSQRPATEKATAALRHGVELPGKLFGLHELKARGHRIELAERENIDWYSVLRLAVNAERQLQHDIICRSKNLVNHASSRCSAVARGCRSDTDYDRAT